MRASEELSRDDRPVDDLVKLAQMLAVGRIDAGGNVVPLQTRDLESSWEYLRQNYREELFSVTPPEAVAWHCLQADDSETEGNVKAALFHTERALENRPGHPVLLQRRATLTEALAHGIRNWAGRSNALKLIPPRDPGACADQIDLSPHYTLGLQDELPQWPGEYPLAGFPEGLQTYEGVRFEVRGILGLSSQQSVLGGYSFSNRVDGIRIGRKCRQLHFLQATAWEQPNGSAVGAYVLHYAGGESERLEIRYGCDLAQWLFDSAPKRSIPSQGSRGAILVWIGKNRFSQTRTGAICFYKSTRPNPRPDLVLERIDFVSAMANASPFLLALTVE
jgi:hypothetical protein